MNVSPKRAQTEQDSLKPGKFSRKVKKNSPPPQMEQVIIYLTSSKRIYVEPEEFKAVVQRLRGNSLVVVAPAAPPPPPLPPSEEGSSADGVTEEFDLPDCFSCLSPLNLHLPQVSWKSDSLVLMPTEAAFKRKGSSTRGKGSNQWVKGSNHLHERKGSSFFFAFGWNLAYIPVASDSFGATDCPCSRVLKLKP